MPFLVGLAVGIGLTAYAFLSWIYDPDGIPGLLVVIEHLRAMRAMVQIIKRSSDALAQMLDAARRG